MNIKALGKIRHNGEDFKSGDTISGLSEKEYKRLLDLGVAEEVEAAEEVNQPSNLIDGGNLPLAGLILTVEQFSELKADDQKTHLKALEIDPASKEEDRIAQYEEWYAEKLAVASDPDGQL